MMILKWVAKLPSGQIRLFTITPKGWHMIPKTDEEWRTFFGFCKDDFKRQSPKVIAGPGCCCKGGRP